MSLLVISKDVDITVTGRRADAILSLEEVDRDGEVTVIGDATSGIDLGPFLKNPIACKDHRPADLIGRWEHVRKTHIRGVPALVGTLVGLPPGVSAVADQTWGEIAHGRDGISIQFRSRRQGPPRWPGQTGVTHEESELYEASSVPLPSCRGCVLTSKSCGCAVGAVCSCASRRVLSSRDVILRHLSAFNPPPVTPTIRPTGPTPGALKQMALRQFLGVKSGDLDPTSTCPRGARCPSKAAQLNVRECPAVDCPLKPMLMDTDNVPKAIEPVYEIDLEDDREPRVSENDLPFIRRAVLEGLRPVMRELVAEFADEIQSTLTATTGRI